MSRKYLIAIIIIGLTGILLTIAFINQPRVPSSYGDNFTTSQPVTQETYRGNYSTRNGLSFSFQRESSSTQVQAEEQPCHDCMYSVAEADLLAQERVAYWTLWIGVFTALGLGALVWTIFETREMTVATRQIGVSQSRAYLAFEPQQVISFEGNKIDVNLIMRNTGKTPAINMKFWAETSFIEWPPSGNDLIDVNEAGVGSPVAPESALDITAKWKSANITNLTNPCPATYGIVHYEDVFGGRYKARFCFSIANMSAQGKPDTVFFGHAPNHNDESQQ